MAAEPRRYAPSVINRLYGCPACKRRTESTIHPSKAGHWCSEFDAYVQWEVVVEGCPTCGSVDGNCYSDD